MTTRQLYSPALPAVALLCCLAPTWWGCLSGEPWSEGLGETSAGIIGGTETQEWEPIGAYWQLDYGAMCTASLVSDDVVLLAEHCVTSPSAQQAFFVGYDVNMMDETNTYDISECIVSPLGHDTAICLLAEPLTTVDKLPINLTPFDETWDEQWFHYVGFGVDTGYGGVGSGIKRETDIQMYSWDEWEYVHYADGTNTCSGDSGGPSLVEVDGHHYIAGVNSSVFSKTGDPCSGYGVEMRVDAQLDFLDDYFDPLEYQPDPGDDDDTADDDDSIEPFPDGGSPFAYGVDGTGEWSSLCATGGSGRVPWSVLVLALLWLARLRHR